MVCATVPLKLAVLVLAVKVPLLIKLPLKLCVKVEAANVQFELIVKVPESVQAPAAVAVVPAQAMVTLAYVAKEVTVCATMALYTIVEAAPKVKVGAFVFTIVVLFAPLSPFVSAVCNVPFTAIIVAFPPPGLLLVGIRLVPAIKVEPTSIVK